MCILASGSATLSSTIVYAAEVKKPDGETVHVMGYQNKVFASGDAPNAMILPIPSLKPLGPENLIDAKAKGMEGVLKAYAQALQPHSRGVSKGIGSPDSLSFQVFDSGAYTVALASSAADLLAALAQVPERKRPALRADLLAGLEGTYPGWPIVICCFNNDDFGGVEPDPLFWWYEPVVVSRLFAPAIDAHDGGPPRPGLVDRDHTLVFGSYKLAAPRSELTQAFDKVAPEARWMLTAGFTGSIVGGRGQNGDFVMPLIHLQSRDPKGIRVQIPPGWLYK